MTKSIVESITYRPEHTPSQPPNPGRATARRKATTLSAASVTGTSNTTDMSEDESADLSLEDHDSSTESHGAVKREDGGDHGSRDTAGDNPSMPMQKRRRVTRACDECRRKKIKCDGKQPCTHCSVYSYGNQGNPTYKLGRSC